MKTSFKIILVTAILIGIVQLTYGHGPKKHDHKEPQKTAQDSTSQPLETKAIEMEHEDEHENGHDHVEGQSTIVNATFDDFSNLHPMIVHFPIVLLLLAFVTQLSALFIWKKELSLVTGLLLLVGVGIAYLASTAFHPHTAELSNAAQKVLDLHDQYADYTIWSGTLALLVKIASHFFLKRKLWMEIIVVVILGLATWSVSQAAHYGATLVHLHGVGPQGKYLEVHEH